MFVPRAARTNAVQYYKQFLQMQRRAALRKNRGGGRPGSVSSLKAVIAQCNKPLYGRGVNVLR